MINIEIFEVKFVHSNNCFNLGFGSVYCVDLFLAVKRFIDASLVI